MESVVLVSSLSSFVSHSVVNEESVVSQSQKRSQSDCSRDERSAVEY
jgi:hypothetical protein